MTGSRPSLPAIVAFLLLLAVAGLAWGQGGARLFLATLIGGFAGFALYHASFGFTAGWRRIITEARGTGLRAQFLLIGLTVIVSYPLIGWGDANGWVLPVNLQMMVGAFLFGMGMQLGGGCGSGTLFVVGGGSTRMVITLSCFIFGSVVGVAHLGWWRGSPSLGNHSAISYFGVIGAMVLTLALLAALGVVEHPAREGRARITGACAQAGFADHRALVALGRSHRARHCGHPDAAGAEPALGDHAGLRVLGREGAGRGGRASGDVADVAVVRTTRCNARSSTMRPR